MRKEVCRSIVKRPFCTHPAMQVFADLRLSLVLVVPAGTLGETCALPDETSSAASVGRLRSTSEPESVCRRAVGNARPLSSARS